MKTKSLVVFDLETGGLAMESPVIQVAAIAVDSCWNELATFEAKVLFNEDLAEPEALKINHYDSELWKREGRNPVRVVSDFTRFLEPFKCIQMTSKKGSPYSIALLAAYNSEFDNPRLKRMYAGGFLPAHPRALCIMQRALWFAQETGLDVENFRLESVAKALGVHSDGAHDALVDVRMAIAVAKEMEKLTCKQTPYTA